MKKPLPHHAPTASRHPGLKKAALAALLSALLLTAACTSIDCPMNNSVYTNYSLLKSNGTADTLTDSLTIITKTLGPEQDPVLINRDINVSSFSLPISYSSPEDELYFVVGSLEAPLYVDTVWVMKTDRMHLESVDCTPSYFHTLTGVRHTRHVIDSIVIKNHDVTYDAEKEHFHLYLHPDR